MCFVIRISCTHKTGKVSNGYLDWGNSVNISCVKCAQICINTAREECTLEIWTERIV